MFSSRPLCRVPSTSMWNTTTQITTKVSMRWAREGLSWWQSMVNSDGPTWLNERWTSNPSRHPSQGKEWLDRQDPQAHCPHFHSQGSGSTPNLLYDKEKPHIVASWEVPVSQGSVVETRKIEESCCATPQTLRQLFVLRVVQTAGLPDVTFPTCPDLGRIKCCKEKGWGCFKCCDCLVQPHICKSPEPAHTF